MLSEALQLHTAFSRLQASLRKLFRDGGTMTCTVGLEEQYALELCRVEYPGPRWALFSQSRLTPITQAITDACEAWDPVRTHLRRCRVLLHRLPLQGPAVTETRGLFGDLLATPWLRSVQAPGGYRFEGAEEGELLAVRVTIVAPNHYLLEAAREALRVLHAERTVPVSNPVNTPAATNKRSLVEELGLDNLQFNEYVLYEAFLEANRERGARRPAQDAAEEVKALTGKTVRTDCMRVRRSRQKKVKKPKKPKTEAGSNNSAG